MGIQPKGNVDEGCFNSVYEIFSDMFLGKKGASGDSDTRFADLNVVKDTFKGG